MTENIAHRVKLVGLIMSITLLVPLLATMPQKPVLAEPQSTIMWTDDFDSYTVPIYPDTYFPSPPWTHSGYHDAFVYHDYAKSAPNALKLIGVFGEGECGGAVAYRYIGGFAPFEIEVWLRNGDEPLAGCHQKYGGIELSAGPDWTYDHRGLINFNYQQQIRGGAFELDEGAGVNLGSYTPLQWYKVRIRYEPLQSDNILLTFWINDVQQGPFSFPKRPYEGNLAYVGLWAGEGAAWFDNVWMKATPLPLNERLYLPAIVRQ
jgi:hypothetical protein